MTAMNMLGVYLEPHATSSTRIGTLLREPSMTRFIVDANYIALGVDRPIFSAAFWAPNDEVATLVRLQNEQNKIARSGHLPPFLANLLPEGALRDLISAQLIEGPQDDFTLLKRLGADLPGAVVVRTEEISGHIRTPRLGPPPSPASFAPGIKFSLAGVQLKFSMSRDHERLTMPASGVGGKVIVKLASKEAPFLCEAEYLAMRLAEAVGVEVAQCELVQASNVEGIKRDLVVGSHVLAVDRFDRLGHERVHMEEFASILGLAPVAKYSANLETVIKLISRFSTRPYDDVLEAIRRIVVDILVGNGDAHLKNWSFIYRDPLRPVLSPAYDIVPVVLYLPQDDLALRLGGIQAFRRVTRKMFTRLAQIAEIPEASVLNEIDRVLERALDEWPKIFRDVPIPKDFRDVLERRWRTLPLCGHLPNPFAHQTKVRVELMLDEEVIGNPAHIRPQRNSALKNLISFVLPNRVAIDSNRSYQLRFQEGATTPIGIRSVRTSGRNKTRVVAEVTPMAPARREDRGANEPSTSDEGG